MRFFGAETEHLREHGATTREAGRRLDGLITQLDVAVRSAEWTGGDAEAFRQRWEAGVLSRTRSTCEQLDDKAAQLDQEAEEQDTCSSAGSQGPGGTGGSHGGPVKQWLDSYQAKESDGFFGDLLGGPEAGYWGNLGWSGVSIAGDIAGLVPEPSGVAAGFGLAIDAASAGIGLYDAAQAFQDGDPFGTFDGLVTAGVNLLDIPAGVLSMVPVPHVKAVGEALGIATGSLDIAWSTLTAEAQASAIAGGPGGGSTSRFMLEMPGWALEQATGNSALSEATESVTSFAEDGFGRASQAIRDAVPIIDPMIDAPQHVVENAVPSAAQDWVEGTASDANEWIRDRMPW